MDSIAIGLNDRIVKKIQKMPIDEEIRKFLLKMIGFELDHSNEIIWRYTQDYQRELDKTMKKMKGG